MFLKTKRTLKSSRVLGIKIRENQFLFHLTACLLWCNRKEIFFDDLGSLVGGLGWFLKLITYFWTLLRIFELAYVFLNLLTYFWTCLRIFELKCAFLNLLTYFLNLKFKKYFFTPKYTTKTPKLQKYPPLIPIKRFHKGNKKNNKKKSSWFDCLSIDLPGHDHKNGNWELHIIASLCIISFFILCLTLYILSIIHDWLDRAKQNTKNKKKKKKKSEIKKYFIAAALSCIVEKKKKSVEIER